jgi:hypothetical protein
VKAWLTQKLENQREFIKDLKNIAPSTPTT